MKKILAIVVLGLSLSGCGGVSSDNIGYSIRNTAQIQGQISLGDFKSSVVPFLVAQQSHLGSKYLKPADQYIKDGKTTYIHYQRTGLVEDGRTTDDEFTPYVFENEKLIAIGWASLGGPKVLGGGGSVTINDPVRDRNAAIKRYQGLTNGSCTLRDLSNC